MNNFHKGHQEIASHTTSQARMFFASSHSLGYEPEEVKERAKKHFNLDCFNKINVQNMIELIDRLSQKQMEKIRKES